MLKSSTQSLKSKSKSYLNNTTKVLTSSTDYAHSGVIVLLEPLNCDHIKKWSSTTVREPVVFTSWAVGINGLKVCQGNIPLNITPPAEARTVDTRLHGVRLLFLTEHLQTWYYKLHFALWFVVPVGWSRFSVQQKRDWVNEIYPVWLLTSRWMFFPHSSVHLCWKSRWSN